MKRLLLAVLVLAAAACRKAAPAPEAASTDVVAGEKLIDFDEQHGAFACRAPADWKAVEDDYSGGPLVMFMGPVSGPSRGTAAISVARYPATGEKIKTPEDFVQSLKLSDLAPSALEPRTINGRSAYAVHYEIARRDPRSHKVLFMDREESVLIPAVKGFFALTHTAPAATYRATQPVFDAVVQSFKPKG